MQALYLHYTLIGPDIDVPAGDMGVGGREIGFLFAGISPPERQLQNGVLILVKASAMVVPHSSGSNGLRRCLLPRNVLRDGQDIKGKTIAAAGFGNDLGHLQKLNSS